MPKRRKYSGKEFDELQRLKYENEKLKKQVSSLRKQITRLDIDRYENLRDLIDKYDNLEKQEVSKKEKQKLKEKWACFECRTGVMQIHTIFRIDGQFYYRKCNSCLNKTKLKPFNDKVEGFFSDENIEDKE